MDNWKKCPMVTCTNQSIITEDPDSGALQGQASLVDPERFIHDPDPTFRVIPDSGPDSAQDPALIPDEGVKKKLQRVKGLEQG
jgi:hypothetical protein